MYKRGHFNQRAGSKLYRLCGHVGEWIYHHDLYQQRWNHWGILLYATNREFIQWLCGYHVQHIDDHECSFIKLYRRNRIVLQQLDNDHMQHDHHRSDAGGIVYRSQCEQRKQLHVNDL